MGLFSIILMGIGLAIDASCVCTTNGLVYKPNLISSLKIALPFAVFQGIMPLIGYFGIGIFPDEVFKYNHIIAFILLCIVGVNMIVEARKPHDDEIKQKKGTKLTWQIMLIQGISTSIDALTVGITLGEKSIPFMLMAVTIVSSVTFAMCFGSVLLGKKIGTKLNSKAEVFGAIVLILLGVKLLMDGIL